MTSRLLLAPNPSYLVKSLSPDHNGSRNILDLHETKPLYEVHSIQEEKTRLPEILHYHRNSSGVVVGSRKFHHVLIRDQFVS